MIKIRPKCCLVKIPRDNILGATYYHGHGYHVEKIFIVQKYECLPTTEKKTRRNLDVGCKKFSTKSGKPETSEDSSLV